MNYLVLLITAFLLNPADEMCSCLPPGEITHEKFNDYDIILQGKIKDAKEDNKMIIYTVEVDKIYKGKAGKQQIEIKSHWHSGMCGIGFVPGQEWLIYGYKKENYFITNLCTRSLRMDTESNRDRLNNDLSFLKKVSQ